MKSSTVAALLCLGTCVCGGAFAAEFSIKGDVSQTFDASNNYFMSPSPSGITGHSLSTIDLDFLAATPTTQYDLKTNYGYYSYFGPGAQDTQQTFGTTPGASFTIDHVEPLTKYNFNSSWQRSDLATTVLTETGTFAGRGTVDTYNFGGGLKHTVTAVDTATWSAQGSTVSYSDPTQTPYFDFSSNVGWNHNISTTTTLIALLNFDWLMVDNLADSQRLYWNPTAGVQSQLTKRLFFYGTVGAGFVNAYQKGFAGSVLPGAFQQNTGASKNWLANMNLNYQISHNTNAAITATRAITPTVLGQLLNIESVGFSVSHTINSRSNVSLNTQYSQTTTAAVGTTSASVSDFLTASASYGYVFARDWRGNFSYTYSQRNDITGLVRASAVSMTLTHDFTLFGKPPTEIQKTQSEIAQQDLIRAQRVFPTIGGFPN